MASRVTINHTEAAKLLKSEEVIKHLREVAEDIAISTGKPEDYAIEEWVGVNRARVSIWTDSTAARINEATNHTLLEALGENLG